MLSVLHQMEQTKSLIETGRLVKIIITAVTLENELVSTVLVRLVETFKYIRVEIDLKIIPLHIHMINTTYHLLYRAGCSEQKALHYSSRN